VANYKKKEITMNLFKRNTFGIHTISKTKSPLSKPAFVMENRWMVLRNLYRQNRRRIIKEY
jgi:hypothetical protein